MKYFIETLYASCQFPKIATFNEYIPMNIIIDTHIGVSGAKIHWMKSKDGKLFWCRQAIAVMGSFNMAIEEIERISPFDPNFHDNYIEGKGKTKGEALAQMQKGAEEISDSLWII